MSTSSTPVTEAVGSYLQELFNSEDDFLRQLNIEAASAGIPPISIAPEQTRFLQVLLKAINARTVVEIGSLGGYSSIAMARALPPDGRLYACELEPMHAEFIATKVKQAQLDAIVRVVQGAALETLPVLLKELSAESLLIDAVFIDADKENYENYLHLVLPFMRQGGLVIGDNALGFGYIASDPPEEERANVEALRKFNQTMSSNSSLLSTLVPLGDGMVIGVVR